MQGDEKAEKHTQGIGMMQMSQLRWLASQPGEYHVPAHRQGRIADTAVSLNATGESLLTKTTEMSGATTTQPHNFAFLLRGLLRRSFSIWSKVPR